MEKEYFEVCLCSLLHDIGKFAWRCVSEEESKSDKGEWLSHEDWNKRIVRPANINFKNWSKNYTPESNCVWLGDWISAQEREDLDEQETQDRQESFARTKTIPLLTPFSEIIIETDNERNKSIIPHYYKHQNLCLEFPSDDHYAREQKTEFNKETYASFESQIRYILGKYDINIEEQSISLLREISDLLKMYFMNIPSATW